VAIATTCLVAIAAPAWGGIKATNAQSETVTSASWGAAGATTSGSTTLGSPFVVSWALITLFPTSQYFKVTNTGTLALTGETYTTVNSGGPTVSLTACVGGTWNSSSGVCPSGGTQVSLGQSGGGATTSTTAIPVGSSLSVRAQTTGLLSLGTFTTSVTVTAARSQVRAGTTTNS
jgi:hypothetical protein